MELKDNPAVIRIPLVDPSSKKEGVLRFGLPRECMNDGACEPQFYATQDTVAIGVTADAPQPVATPAAPAASRPGENAPGPQSGDARSLVDLVIEDVRGAHANVQMIGTDISYAGFTLKRTRSDFQRLDSPLGVAAADTRDLLVSDAGMQLDFILWSARNGLHDCQRGLANSSGDANGASSTLSDASAKLGGLRSSIQSGSALLVVLDEAQDAIDRALENTSKMTSTLLAGTASLRDGDASLMFADQYVGDIKDDHAGRDVSSSARRLRSSVDDVKGRLGMADDTLKSVEPQITPTESDLEHAEKSLEAVRAALTHEGAAQ